MTWKSQFPALAEALVAPFYDDEVKFKPGTKWKAPFITARHCMNRLDDVLGFENWEDEYIPTPDGCVCRLTITLPNGTRVTKSDAGGNAGMQDKGDNEKSSFSDAFKRACAKFGIGRYLYGSGVPCAARHRFRLKDDGGVYAPLEGHPYNVRPEDSDGPAQAPADAIAKVERWVRENAESYNAGWRDELVKRGLDSDVSLLTPNFLAREVARLAAEGSLVPAAPRDAGHDDILALLLVGLRADEARMEELSQAVYSATWKSAVKAARQGAQAKPA
jgi:hypothetical protein